MDETEYDQQDSIEDEVIPKIEVKRRNILSLWPICLPQVKNEVQQPIVDRKDLDAARSRLRSREHSADTHLTTLIIPTKPSSVQRSVSLKRTEDIHIPTDSNTKHEEVEEHIYDNFDFCQHQLRSREQAARLRPVTMYFPTNTDRTMPNELENVFNQFKNKSLNKRTPSKERKEEISVVIIDESLQPSTPLEQTSDDFVVKQETSSTLKNKTTETPNRRRTVGGVNLMEPKKLTTEEQQAQQPSWIQIARQKQSKL